MASVNKAILIGHVGKEPDIRTTSSGDTVASFSLATNSGYGDNKTTDWHNVIFFGKTADFIKDYVSWGCGPRACLNLITGAKARAILRGRFSVSAEDIQALAQPVMRHRMGLNFAAQSEGVDTNDIINRLIKDTSAGKQLYDGAA